MAEGALRELLAHFQVEVDDHELVKFEGGLGGVIEKLKHAAGVFAGLFAAGEIKEFFLQTIEQTGHLADLSEKLGISTEEIQKFQFAASLAGVEGEAAAGALGKLNRAIGEALHGGEAEEKFKKLGIELKDTHGQLRATGEVVLDVADKMKDLKTAPERTAMAMKLFGRSGMALVPMLQEGREEMEKLYGEFEHLGGVMSKDFVKQAKKADDEMTKMHVAFRGLRVRAVNAFLPQVMAVIKSFEKYAMVAQHVLDKTNALHHAFDFVKIIASIKIAMALIQPFLTALVTGLSPLTLMVLAATALFLIFDDLMTMMEGGDSVIGDALGPDKAAMVASLKASFDEMSATWKEMLPDIKEIGKNIFELAIKALPLIIDALSLGVTMTLEWVKAVKALVDGFKALFSGHFFDALGHFEGAAGHWLDSLTGGKLGIGKAIDKNTEGARQYVTGVGKNTGTLPGMEPGGEYVLPGFTPKFGMNAALPFAGQGGMPSAPIHIQQTFHTNVDVSHTSGDDPKDVGTAIGAGVTKKAQLELQNTKNTVKKK